MKSKFIKLTTVLISVLMISSIFAGCGAKDNSKDVINKEGEALKEVTLKFYMFGDKKAETDNVWNKISEQYKDKLNVKFDINFIPGSDYAQKLTVMAASGDTWDMNFDGDWLSYYQMINKGAYMDLTELLPKYAPDLYAAYKEQGTLAAATVGGKIVSLPWTMKMSQRPFFAWRSDLTEKAGIDVKDGSVKTLEEMDKVYAALKKADPNVKIAESLNKTVVEAKYELAEISHAYVFDINDSKCTVLPFEQNQAFKEYTEYAKKWQDSGYIWKDVLIDKTDKNQMIDEGKLITYTPSHEWAEAIRGGWSSHPDFKKGTSLLYPDKKQVNRTALANIMAINKNSENPERTLMFLNLIQTDKKLYDLVQYGIEGKTYKLNGDKADYPTGMNSVSSNYMEWGGQWALWKPEFMRPNATYTNGFWKKEAEFASKDVNITSPLDGFFFDTTKVKNEIAQRDQIFGDADKLISVGIVDNADKAVDDLIKREKAAGVDKITVELQKQVDEFLAAKSK